MVHLRFLPPRALLVSPQNENLVKERQREQGSSKDDGSFVCAAVRPRPFLR